MEEFLSFILFVVFIVGSLYALFMVILPLLVIYLGGVTMVILSATYLVRQDKRRARFASVPASWKVLRQVTLLAVVLPVLHAALMWLFKDMEWVIWVLGLNLLLALGWLAFFVLRVRRSVKTYKQDGGERKMLMNSLISRVEALKIQADALKCLLDKPQGLEPWEEAVLGDEALETEVDRDRVQKLLAQIQQMIERLDRLGKLSELMAMKQDDRESSTVYVQIRSILQDTQDLYKQSMDESRELIGQYEF